MPHRREVEFCQVCQKFLLDTNGMIHTMEEHPEDFRCKDELIVWVEQNISVALVEIQDT